MNRVKNRLLILERGCLKICSLYQLKWRILQTGLN